MTKEQLENRIQAKEKMIEKIEKRISKWENKKNEKSFWKEHEYLLGDSLNWNRSKVYERFYQAYIDDCDHEIKCANNDLIDSKETLEKYKNALANLEAFDSSEKIKVIMDFLEEWKQKANEWYHENAKLYFKLHDEYKEKYDEELKEYLKEYEDKNISDMERHRIKNNFYYGFNQKYYEDIQVYTRDIANPYRKEIDEEKLEKDLTKEVRLKYENLVARITKVVGEIQDAAGLSIGNKSGEINGIIIGSKGRCSVETISAGGYNIQCFHYRILIHKIK